MNITVSGRAWEPEVRFTSSGMCVANVSISCYIGKGKDGKAQYMNIKVIAFKELATALGDSVQKGDNVVVTGRLSEEQWTGKDGNKQRRTTIIADDIAKSIRTFAKKSETADSFGSEVDTDDIPF